MNFDEVQEIFDKLLKDDITWNSIVQRNLSKLDNQITISEAILNNNDIPNFDVDLLKVSFVALLDYYPACVLEDEDEYNEMLDVIRHNKHYTSSVKVNIPFELMQENNNYNDLKEFLEICAKMYIKATKNNGCNCYDK